MQQEGVVPWAAELTLQYCQRYAAGTKETDELWEAYENAGTVEYRHYTLQRLTFALAE